MTCTGPLGIDSVPEGTNQHTHAGEHLSTLISATQPRNLRATSCPRLSGSLDDLARALLLPLLVSSEAITWLFQVIPIGVLTSGTTNTGHRGHSPTRTLHKHIRHKEQINTQFGIQRSRDRDARDRNQTQSHCHDCFDVRWRDLQRNTLYVVISAVYAHTRQQYTTS